MNLLAGVSLGLLVGLLLGLSVSPVVGSSVAALLAVVVTFFGFGGSVAVLSVQTSAQRVLAFSLSMAFAVVLGVVLRSHGSLSPSVSYRVAEWTRAGYGPERARELAEFQILGILPDNSSLAKADAPPSTAGVLFAQASTGDCAALEADRFASPEDRLRAMINTGSPWSALKDYKAPTATDQLGSTLDAVWLIMCGGQAKI